MTGMGTGLGLGKRTRALGRVGSPLGDYTDLKSALANRQDLVGPLYRDPREYGPSARLPSQKKTVI